MNTKINNDNYFLIISFNFRLCFPEIICMSFFIIIIYFRRISTQFYFIFFSRKSHKYAHKKHTIKTNIMSNVVRILINLLSRRYTLSACFSLRKLSYTFETGAAF